MTRANSILVAMVMAAGAASALWMASANTSMPSARVPQTRWLASERAVTSSTAIRRRRGASGANTPSATARPNAAITTPATNPYEISIMRTSVASSSVTVSSGVASARQRKTPNEESALEDLSDVPAATVNRRCHQNQSIATAIASTVKTSNATPTRGQPRLSWTAVDQFCKERPSPMSSPGSACAAASQMDGESTLGIVVTSCGPSASMCTGGGGAVGDCAGSDGTPISANKARYFFATTALPSGVQCQPATG